MNRRKYNRNFSPPEVRHLSSVELWDEQQITGERHEGMERLMLHSEKRTRNLLGITDNDSSESRQL